MKASRIQQLALFLLLIFLGGGGTGLTSLNAQTLGVYRELWTGLTGVSLGNLTNSTVNPDWPDNPNPAYTTNLNRLEAIVNNLDDYGQRLRAFLVPPTRGYYTFWVAGDDSCAVLLSTDETPAQSIPMASVSFSGFREWEREPTQRSVPVFLEAGRRYYVEALHKEALGNAHVSVRWQLPDGQFEEPITDVASDGPRLIPFNGMETLPGIFTQPTNLTVLEGSNATLSLLVTNPAPVSYQWQLEGVNLPGPAATQPVYTIDRVKVAEHDGTHYRCVVSNSVSSIFSTEVILTVIPDITPPTLFSASNLGLTNVTLIFSERVDPVSAANPANYQVSSGVAVSSVQLSNPQTVTLTVSSLIYGSNYTVTVSNVRDLASLPNTMAEDSQISFTAGGFIPVDINEASPPGSVTIVEGGSDVSGGGNNIGGMEDQFQFSYQWRAGDFDVKVRLSTLSHTHMWAKAGLMARETLDPDSRFAAALATPSLAGSLFASRGEVGLPSSMAGSLRVSYPNTWLRLRRVGDVFTGFGGVDGEHWQELGSATVFMPTTLYFGLAVSSHDTNAITTASFRELTDATGTSSENLILPFEPLSASSQRTGLVLSEIMYHPAARPDLLDLEYIELFNSQLFPEDISGYRLSGDVDYLFPQGTLLPGGAFLVVAKSPVDVQDVYGLANVMGPFLNSLPNDSGRVRLRNREDAIQLEVNYDSKSPWPKSADGAGHSLVLARPSYGENDPRAWTASDQVGGSPGQVETFSTASEPLREVVINEFLAHTADPELDFIELYNHSNLPVDLSGAWLSDARSAFTGPVPTTNAFRIPDGTMLAPRGWISFDQTQLGFALSSGGESIYLVNPNRTRVIDAVRFEAQALGVATGRWPDGAPGFQELQSPTPGAANASMLTRDIVINEIMYHPISRDSDDEYIELHNRGAGTVSLADWELGDGIRFTFPEDASIPPGGYLVVANNLTNLLARYPQLDTSNAVGDFNGQLADSGERVVLTMAETVVATNTLGVVTTNLHQIVVDEVTYGEGGRWSPFADAGGSSLELIDAGSDNRLADNWADSDESSKADWTTVELTGVLDNTDFQADALEIYLMGAGEFLLDDVEVISTFGQNVLTNPDFESGLSPWLVQGNHETSSWQPNGGMNDGPCLHARASGKGDASVNRLRVPFTATLAVDSTATLRARVRWLRGHPQVLLRLLGNGLDAFGHLSIPPDLGTPGAANSRAAANAGPAIFDVRHQPVLPAAGEPVLVTARLQDSDGLSQALVTYRIDPDTASPVTVPLVDDGTGGDVVAGDGLFSATLPGQAAGELLAFFVQATDNAAQPETRTFPSDAPGRECLVRFGEIQPTGAFGTYRVWVTQATFNEWSERPILSNAALDSTFVYGNQRVIYNAGAFYSGAGAGARDYTTPTGVACDYKLEFPDDDRFLGNDEASILWPGLSGNRPQDLTGQQEQTVYWVAASLGLPFNYQRHVHVFFNGVHRSYLMLDTQKPGRDLIDQWYPEDSEGDLFKIKGGREYNDDGIQIAGRQAHLGVFATTGGVKKTAPYRHTWPLRAAPDLDDYNSLFALADAVHSSEERYLTEVDRVVDVEQWMRTFAVEHIVGNWDCYGYGNSQNMYAYKPENGGWKMIMWDVDVSLAIGDPPTTGLFTLTNRLFLSVDGDPDVVGRMYGNPQFVRAYWRAFHDAVNGPLLEANVNALMDPKAAAFADSGVPAASTTPIKTYLSDRRAYIIDQLATVEAPLAVTSPDFISTEQNIVHLSGTAPVEIRDLTFNGLHFPVTWTSVNGWAAPVVLQPGTNQIVVQGLDRLGLELAGLRWTNTVIQTGLIDDAVGTVVFSEIMYQPTVPNATFVEIYNNSATTSFDLSGWRINGLGFTFPVGTIITNGQHLVVAENLDAFVSVYGDGVPVAGEYDGSLDPDGETLTLIQPGQEGMSEIEIDKVRYEPSMPWVTTANGTGPSLMLVDAAEDNSRPSNWSDGSGWRFLSFSKVAGSGARRLFLWLDQMGDVYIDDVWLSQSEEPEDGPNLLANGDFESGLLSPWGVTGTHTTSVVTNEQVHSGNFSLHLIAEGAGSSSSSLLQSLRGVDTTNVYTLSFYYLPSTPARLNYRISAGHRTDPVDPDFFPAPDASPAQATPGILTTTAFDLPHYDPVWLNEVQADNATGMVDGQGEADAWVELYNGGPTQVSLEGYFLAGNYTSNLTEWPFPAGTVIDPGEFKIVWMDGQPGQTAGTELHASFALPSDTGQIALTRLVDGLPQITDYLTYTGVGVDQSYGSFPDGQPFKRIVFDTTTPGAVNQAVTADIYINEWLAANGAFLSDPADGNFEDWFELYNAGSEAVDLTGYFLTDDLNKKQQFQIPAGYVIAPGGFLLVWADNDAEQNLTHPDPTHLHVNFALSRGGESIGLYSPDGIVVDEITFETQFDDVSQGRFPDGSSMLAYMTSPTPGGANNEGVSNSAPVLDPIVDRVLTLGQSLSFTVTATDADVPAQVLTFSLLPAAPAGMSLNVLSGQISWTPVPAQAPGTNVVTVRVTDNGIPLLSDEQSFTITVLLPPQITILRTGSEVSLSFQAIPGRTYRVHYANDLNPPIDWQPLDPDVLAIESSITINDPIGSQAQRFYIIQQLD